MGGDRIATLYRLTSLKNPPSRIDLPTLEAIIGTLRKITGEPVTLDTLFEVVEPEAAPIDVETRMWLEADLAPPLEPYDWGEADPEMIGEPLRYEPGKGWITDG